MGELVLIIVVAPLYLLYLWLARLLVRPVLEIADFREAPARFQWIDLAALVPYLSITGLASWRVLQLMVIDGLRSTLVVGSAISFAGSLWWIAARTLSRASVDDLRKRVAFLMLAVPLAYLTPLVILFALFVLGRILVMSMSPFYVIDAIFSNFHIVTVTFGAALICHCMCLWIAADVEGDRCAIGKLHFDD